MSDRGCFSGVELEAWLCALEDSLLLPDVSDTKPFSGVEMFERSEPDCFVGDDDRLADADDADDDFDFDFCFSGVDDSADLSDNDSFEPFSGDDAWLSDGEDSKCVLDAEASCTNL